MTKAIATIMFSFVFCVGAWAEAKPKLSPAAAVKAGEKTRTEKKAAIKPAKKKVAPRQQGPIRIKTFSKTVPFAGSPSIICKRDPSVPAGRVDIRERICESKRLLAERRAEIKVCATKTQIYQDKKKKQIRQGRPICRRIMLLAALEVKSGKLGILEIPAGGKLTSAGFTLRRLSRDGVDSEFDVKSPPGWVVTGIQYPLTIKVARGFQRVRAVYTPFSGDLLREFPELAKLGQDYLDQQIMEAASQIKKAGVDVSDISPTVLKTLILVEHFTALKTDEAAVLDEVERIFATLGANGPDAFKYSVSGAGARGIGQFMKQTWETLRGRYPKLLPAEFFSGSGNHAASLRAQFLLAKENQAYLFSRRGWRDRDRRAEFLKDERAAGQFQALAYNAGAYRAYCWEESRRRMNIPGEARGYLAKFAAIWDKAYPSHRPRTAEK